MQVTVLDYMSLYIHNVIAVSSMSTSGIQYTI